MSEISTKAPIGVAVLGRGAAAGGPRSSAGCRRPAAAGARSDAACAAAAHRSTCGWICARRRLADHLGDGQAEDRVLVAAEGARVAACWRTGSGCRWRVVVGDQHRHVVGEQPELARPARAPRARARWPALTSCSRHSDCPASARQRRDALDPGRAATGAGAGAAAAAKSSPPRERRQQPAHGCRASSRACQPRPSSRCGRASRQRRPKRAC